MKTPGVDANAARRLCAARIGHRFGALDVLRDISFDLGAGELLCLAGPSGCGKSTLLRLVAGLELLEQGTIVIDGAVVADSVTHVRAEARGVGLVFQDFALFPHMSILENVAFGLAAHPRAEQRRMALEMLARVGLAARAGDAPHRLSGGEQQRVALARALAPRPRLVLLDEPFSNLDVRMRHSLRKDTLQLLKESATAAILVTHDPEEAMFMADRIALMKAGRIVQIGTPAQVYREPADPFAAEFFGEVNRLLGTVKGGMAMTPLGPVAAPGLEEGAAVEILLRPEAIVLARGNEPTAQEVKVGAVRILGAVSLATIEVPGDQGPVPLQATFPTGLRGPEGPRLHVRLDEAGVFVFRAAGEARRSK